MKKDGLKLDGKEKTILVEFCNRISVPTKNPQRIIGLWRSNHNRNNYYIVKLPNIKLNVKY